MKILNLILIIVLFSCKEQNNETSPIDLVQGDALIKYDSISSELSSTIKHSWVNWELDKVVSLSDSYQCEDIDKYKEFVFDYSNDSIYINNIYTDDVFSGEIKLDALYKKHGLSKEFILNKFNLITPEKIKYIRNKKV